MESIIVSVSELLKMANELNNEEAEFVEVRISPKDEYDGDVYPASLDFEVLDGYGGGIDFEGIQEVTVDYDYKLDEFPYDYDGEELL